MLKHLSEDGKDVREYQPIGGGGTEFDIVWKYMEQEGIEDQLIMFTDGYPGTVGVIPIL